MVPESPETTEVRPEFPIGMYSARMDEKGRIKLPSVFQTYFSEIGVSKVFVTSLDGCIGQIYTIPVWRANLKTLAESKADPTMISDLLFNANDLGTEADIDASGRITVKQRMREELDLVGQDLHLWASKGRIEILNEARHAEWRLRARGQVNAEGKRRATENLRLLEQAGLQ